MSSAAVATLRSLSLISLADSECVSSACVAALRFQPTKRPQLSAQKPKGKPTILKSSHAGPTPTATSSTTPPTANSTTGTTRPPVKNTLADWAAAGADEDVNGFYGGEKRQRGGRRKRKKNKEDEIVPQNWDDIYDPSRPNSYEEYKNSDEKIREVREWKDRLYAHRMARRHSSDMETDDERQAPSKMNSEFSLGLLDNEADLNRPLCSPTQLFFCAASRLRSGKRHWLITTTSSTAGRNTR